MVLTRRQIMEEVTNRNGFTKKISAETVETLLEFGKRLLESGEDVLIRGFGKFCAKEKKGLEAGIQPLMNL